MANEMFDRRARAGAIFSRCAMMVRAVFDGSVHHEASRALIVLCARAHAEGGGNTRRDLHITAAYRTGSRSATICPKPAWPMTHLVKFTRQQNSS